MHSLRVQFADIEDMFHWELCIVLGYFTSNPVFTPWNPAAYKQIKNGSSWKVWIKNHAIQGLMFIYFVEKNSAYSNPSSHFLLNNCFVLTHCAEHLKNNMKCFMRSAWNPHSTSDASGVKSLQRLFIPQGARRKKSPCDKLRITFFSFGSLFRVRTFHYHDIMPTTVNFYDACEIQPSHLIVV